MYKKLFTAILIICMTCTMFASCKGRGDSEEEPAKVYFLNYKPEQNKQWQDLAALYTEQTGIEVTVSTPTAGQYETTLESEMAKEEAPTLFQVNGPIALEKWEDHCYDLTDTAVYGELTNESYALKYGSKVKGIAYQIESYGLIVNKALLDKAGYSVEDIKSFDDLKEISEDITSRKKKLKFSAFTSAGMDSSSDWRFKMHMSNLPVYFEYKKKEIDYAEKIKGKYLDDYRAFWDLYINNSTCKPDKLANMSIDDARSEFISGKAVFYLNGYWEWDAVVGDGLLAADDVAMIPVYIGVGKEEEQGLCTGSENYWCVNSAARDKDIQATLDFLYWCVTSSEGTTAMTSGMGFTIPYKAAPESDNGFIRQDAENTAAGLTPVKWTFTTMPSEEWMNGIGEALTAYAADQTDEKWDAVKTVFVDGWTAPLY